MSYRSCLATIVLIALASPAAAEVYRCESDGVIEFSDRPCSANDSPHRSEWGISLIPADENLPRLAAENRRFIEARRETLAAQRRLQAKREAAAQVVPEAPRTVVLPVPASHYHYRRPAPEPPPEQARREPRYSALSGPILGTRNRERWEQPSTRSDRRPQ